jgi:hypothetical protein
VGIGAKADEIGVLKSRGDAPEKIREQLLIAPCHSLGGIGCAKPRYLEIPSTRRPGTQEHQTSDRRVMLDGIGDGCGGRDVDTSQRKSIQAEPSNDRREISDSPVETEVHDVPVR